MDEEEDDDEYLKVEYLLINIGILARLNIIYWLSGIPQLYSSVAHTPALADDASSSSTADVGEGVREEVKVVVDWKFPRCIKYTTPKLD